MNIDYFPNEKRITESIKIDDPLLIIIKYDNSEMIIGNIDDCFEHNILLKKSGHSESDIDKYFRIVVNKSGADWLFVCPSDYKNISDSNYRLKQFYNDGISGIAAALKSLHLPENINIPARYRRHIEMFADLHNNNS